MATLLPLTARRCPFFWPQTPSMATGRFDPLAARQAMAGSPLISQGSAVGTASLAGDPGIAVVTSGSGPPLDSGRQSNRSRRQKYVRFSALIGFWIFALVVTGFLVSSPTVPADARAAGVDIGDLTVAQATAVLTQALPNSGDVVTIELAESSVQAPLAELGLEILPEETAMSALVDRWNPISVALSLVTSRDVPAVVAVNNEVLDTFIAAQEVNFNEPAVEPVITYSGTTPTMVGATAGRAIDREQAPAALVNDITSELDRGGEQLAAQMPVLEVEPAVDAAAAERFIADVAGPAATQGLTISVGDESIVISEAQLAAVTTYRVADGQLAPAVDDELLGSLLSGQLSSIDTGATNATWKIVEGAPVVVPSQDGRGVTIERIAEAVRQAMADPAASREVSLTPEDIPAALTTEQAQGLGVVEKVSSFTQKFDYAAYRVQNIGRAAKKLNKSVILPGETLSMNEVVGERTKANGFTRGPVVGEGGILRDDWGGGVSAVATTLWTASFFAGLDAAEQGAHLIWISRYQPGLEATVAWGHLDLKIHNPFDTAVFLTTSSNNTSVTVTMWGTKQYDKVVAKSSAKANIRKPQTVYSNSASCSPSSGIDGFDISVDRIKRKNGEEVGRDTFNTSYIASPRVICGPAPALP